MKPICDVVCIPPAFCSSCVPSSFLSLSRSLYISIYFFLSLSFSFSTLSNIATGDGVPHIDDRLSLSFIVQREMHRDEDPVLCSHAQEI